MVAYISIYQHCTNGFLVNVNSRLRSLYAIAVPPVVCLSVVCIVRAPYSASWNFLQYFYAIWYLGHPLTFAEKFYGDRLRGTPPSGSLNAKGEAKYSDFWHFECCISETMRCIDAMRGKLVLITNRKSYMSFRLVPKSVTLNDLERRNGLYFAWFF